MKSAVPSSAETGARYTNADVREMTATFVIEYLRWLVHGKAKDEATNLPRLSTRVMVERLVASGLALDLGLIGKFSLSEVAQVRGLQARKPNLRRFESEFRERFGDQIQKSPAVSGGAGKPLDYAPRRGSGIPWPR